MKVCLKCKTQLEDDELFCHECGAKQEIEDVEVKPEEQSVEEKFCVHCGKAIEADSMFCPYCGKPQDVEETKSGEPQPKAEETEPEQEKPQKEKPETKKNPKPHTTSEKREKLIAENALEKSILSMIDAHIKRFQEEEGKTVKSILKPQSYPNANIQLFSDANRQFVLKVVINESIEGEKELYERLKDSKFFKMFVKEGSDSNENSLILDFHNDKDQAKNTILDLLVTIYNQPKECSIGYVTNVSGYTLQDKGIEKSETSSGCGCWIWILLGVILLGIIGAGYYFLTQTDDTHKTEENDVVIATSLDETTLPSDPKEFLNSLYNDFYEQGNTDRFDEAVLSKYFTKGAMRKFYVEDSYEEGHYFYCTDFLTHGTISGGPDPDYGHKIVYRLIVTENDGWFKVTNIWDVIKEPVIVHLQVKTIDGALKIVDIRVENDYTEDSSVEFDRESVEKELKAFLAEYVNTLNDNIFAYLSDDFKGVIKKWESTPNVGEWNLFGLNSAAEIRKYTIESLTEPVDDQLCANVKIWIENEEDYYEDETNIYLIHVDDKWLVDEIDEVKQNMKTALSKL